MDELDYFKGGKPNIADNPEMDHGSQKSLDRMDVGPIANYFAKIYGVHRADFDKIFKGLSEEEYHYYAKLVKQAPKEEPDVEVKAPAKIEHKEPSNIIEMSQPNKELNSPEGIVDRSKSVQNTEDNFTKERGPINNPQPEVLKQETFNPGPELKAAASIGNQGDTNMKRIVYASLGECKVTDLKKGDYFAFLDNPTIYKITAAEDGVTKVSDAYGGDYAFANEELGEERMEKLQPTEPDKIVFAPLDPVTSVEDNAKQGYVIYVDAEEPDSYIVTWDTDGENIEEVSGEDIVKLDTEIDEKLIKKLQGIKEEYEKTLLEVDAEMDSDSEKAVALAASERSAEVAEFSRYVTEHVALSDLVANMESDMSIQDVKDLKGTAESYVPEVLARIAGLDLENNEGVYIKGASDALTNAFWAEITARPAGPKMEAILKTVSDGKKQWLAEEAVKHAKNIIESQYVATARPIGNTSPDNHLSGEPSSPKLSPEQDARYQELGGKINRTPEEEREFQGLYAKTIQE